MGQKNLATIVLCFDWLQVIQERLKIDLDLLLTLLDFPTLQALDDSVEMLVFFGFWLPQHGVSHLFVSPLLVVLVE